MPKETWIIYFYCIFHHHATMQANAFADFCRSTKIGLHVIELFLLKFILWSNLLLQSEESQSRISPISLISRDWLLWRHADVPPILLASSCYSSWSSSKHQVKRMTFLCSCSRSAEVPCWTYKLSTSMGTELPTVLLPREIGSFYESPAVL